MTEADGFRVRVLGCGDAFSSGGRFQSAFLLEIGTYRVLMDCGATTLAACWQAGVDPSEIDLVLISHLHGDHFAGLAFFLLDQRFRAKRERALIIAGPAGIGERLKLLLAACFPGVDGTFGFPLILEELDPGAPARTLGRVEVGAAAVDHPSGAPSLGLRVDGGGRRLTYSGDTRWTEGLIELTQGSDLFICECYAYEPGLDSHMNYRTLSANRNRLAVKRIVLTHLNADMLARRAGLELEALDDGMILDL